MTPAREKAYRGRAGPCPSPRGHAVLEKGGAAWMPWKPRCARWRIHRLFNAGEGSVFNADGQHEMDASLMNGSDLRAGAVAGVQNVKNPVSLARRVMDKSNHVLISGMGAFEFAHKQKVELEDDQYFFDQFRYDQWKEVVGTSDVVQLDHSSSWTTAMPATRKGSSARSGAVALDATRPLRGGHQHRRHDEQEVAAHRRQPDHRRGHLRERRVVRRELHRAMARASSGRWPRTMSMRSWRTKASRWQEAVREVVHREVAQAARWRWRLDRDRPQWHIVLDFNCSGMYRGQVGADGVFHTAIFR
jgi:beta-aspartyl-peptidase (threonine type)